MWVSDFFIIFVAKISNINNHAYRFITQSLVMFNRGMRKTLAPLTTIQAL